MEFVVPDDYIAAVVAVIEHDEALSCRLRQRPVEDEFRPVVVPEFGDITGRGEIVIAQLNPVSGLEELKIPVLHAGLERMVIPTQCEAGAVMHIEAVVAAEGKSQPIILK